MWNWEKTRCYGGGNQHKFEPRYDETPRGIGMGATVSYFDLDELRAFLTLKIYKKDICVWCGETIEK